MTTPPAFRKQPLMHPDANTAPLVAAAHRRSEQTRAKAIQALRELGRAGTPVTFESFARHPSVSRSWLYSQRDIRTEIERLRDATAQFPTQSIPASQRTSDASLLTRLNSALERNRKLAEENQRLRRQLAHALGDRRASPTNDTPDIAPNPANTHHTSITTSSR